MSVSAEEEVRSKECPGKVEGTPADSVMLGLSGQLFKVRRKRLLVLLCSFKAVLVK